MAYENININSLRSALNKIDDINSSDFSNLVGKINGSEWSGSVVNHIKGAIEKDISEIKEIQNKIENYKTVCIYIEEYKNLDNNVNSYNSKLKHYQNDKTTYTNKLNKHRTKLRNYPPNEPEINKKYTRNKISEYTKKINKVNSDISDINSKLQSATSRKQTLKSSIDSLIY